MGGLAGKGLPKLQILRIALIASCVGAFELTHANPRMRLQRRAAIAVNARPLIMGQPDEIHDEANEPPLPEECGPYLTIKGKSINAFGALYGVQSVLLLGPLWCGCSLESGQPTPALFGRRGAQPEPARANMEGSGSPQALGRSLVRLLAPGGRNGHGSDDSSMRVVVGVGRRREGMKGSM
mgnify:CR=1 FL=1|jgi:hypothetical protein